MKRAAQPVPSGSADERGTRLDAQEAEFGLVVIAQELAPVVVADGQARGAAGGVGAEHPAKALAQRPQGREPGAGLGRVDPEAIGGAMIHGDEDGRRPLGQRGGDVGPL